MPAASAFADPNPLRTRLRVAALDQWAEAGMALAKSLVSEGGRGFADVARVFHRIAQAVRLATILAMRLCDPTNPAYQPTPVKPRAPRTAELEATAEKAETENETLDASERPKREGFGFREVSDDAILRRPLRDIVKLICRNLGVVPDWSLWADQDETPGAPRAAPTPAARPRPKPVPPPPLQGLFLHRALGRRLTWIRPADQAPAPPTLRSRLRSTASPLALDPIVPGRAVVSACPAVEAAPPGARTSSSAPWRATSPTPL